MPDIEIDKLQIEVSASSEDATKKIRSLASAFRSLKKSLSENGAVSTMANALESLSFSVGDAKNIAEMAKSIKDVGRQEKKVGNVADYLLGISKMDFSNLTSASNVIGELAEIATAVRSVTRERSITQIPQAQNAEPSDAGEEEERTNETIIEQISLWSQLKSKLQSLSSENKTTARTFDRLREKMNFTNSAASRLLSSFKRILYYRMIRSVIRGITSGIKEGIQNLSAYSRLVGTDFHRSLDAIATDALYIKNSFASAAAPLISSVKPAIDAIADAAHNALNLVAQLMAALSGQSTYSKAVKSATKYGDAVAKAASATKKFLLGIDELNIFDANKGGSSKDTLDYSSMFEETEIESRFKAIADKFAEVKKIIQEHIDDIELIVASGSLAIGALLLLTGANIPLGLGAIAFGAGLIWKKIVPSWGGTEKDIKTVLANIELAVSGALLGVGAILALSGANIPLGIGMMATGALIGAGGIALKWSEISENIKKTISEIELVVGGAFLGLGAVLAFSGANIPLGIGLMAAGAVMVASGAALQWEQLKNNISSVLEAIALTVGGSMLALGAILAISGVNIPLGVGLMAAGAIMIASPLMIQWEVLKNNIDVVLQGIELIVGSSLLALGAILAISGVNIPLGIGLMALGALSIATAGKTDWGIVKKNVVSVISAISAILGGSLTVLGVLLILSGAGIGLGLAVLAAGLATSFAAWKIDENPITDFVRRMANNIIAIINKVIDAINNMFHISFGGLTLLGEQVIPAFDVRLANIPHVPSFASGGFPEDGLFYANHGELVGQFSNGRTAVANNKQIVDGIENGVRDANQELVSVVSAGFSQIINAIERGGNNGGDLDMFANAFYPVMQGVSARRGLEI